MMAIFRKLAGLSSERIATPAQEVKPDLQTAAVANAAQRVNERSDQVRATLAALLKANDGQSMPSSHR